MDTKTFEDKKREIVNYCKQAIDQSGRSEKDIREQLGWGMEKMANFLEGSSEFSLYHLNQFARCLGFEVEVVYRQPCDEGSNIQKDAMSNIKQLFCKHEWFTMIHPVTLHYKNHYCCNCNKIEIRFS